MAEVVLSSVAEVIIGQLGKSAVKKIAQLWDVEVELRQLEGTIKTIKSVLADAEKKQVQSEQIKTWLERLEDAVYEADDLVDEFSTEALRQQVTTGNTMVKQVRTFFSTENQFAFRREMGTKIRDLREKLGEISADRHNFHLEMDVKDTQIVTGQREEHSFEREENVIGRDHEKREILKRLFDMETEENLVVIPIVGVGGLGKTTLAQLVVNDAEVQRHFDPILWVNVPKVFDVKIVVKEIIKSKDEKSMDELQKELREKIEDKQYLLVLDDVWDIDNREKWLKLENLLREGASGSRIIVTTRDKKIARLINGREEITYNLGILNEEKAWSLFKKLAFTHGEEPKNGKLVEIGKEIMKKCGGIPLVIRTIASMLYSITLEEWSSFKEKELSTLQDYHEDVIPTLKLSYDHLPSHLKHCFGYCSLFPKNHVFDVEMLINLWMAQGFVRLSDENQCLEDLGYQHFKDLLYRSFFEVVEIDDDSSKVTKCKMHDCMHDLATSVVGTKCLILSSNDEKIDERTCHISFNFTLDSLQHFQALLVKRKRIRTLFFRCGYNSSSRILEKSILKCKFLRALDLHGAGLQIIPHSIGKLKHLRYLDLSSNRMEALPHSITRLQNLQTLNLSNCDCLREIPRDITKLVNLRHLHIGSSFGTTLCYMPGGLDQLTNLRTLSLISPMYLKETCLHLGQWIPLKNESFFLHHISNLKTLRMKGIGNLQHLPDGLKSLTSIEELSIKKCPKLESLSPGLNNLTSLKRLEIQFCDKLEMPNGNDDAIILWQRFQSLSVLNLRGLPKLVALPQGLQQVISLHHIDIAESENLDSVLESVSNLKKLSLVDCPKLKSLPEGIGSLISLNIRKCPILLEKCRDDIGEYWPLICNIEELIFSPFTKAALEEGVVLGESIPVPSESFFYHLSKLKTLKIDGIENLQHLPDGLKRLTFLEALSISRCSKLESLSPGFYHLTSLQRLDISSCEVLDVSNGGSDDVILWQHFQSLSVLWLSGIPKLVALPQGLQKLTALQKISISHCENLEAVLENISNLKSLKELNIEFCPNLKSLPKGIDSLTSLLQLNISDCEELDVSNGGSDDAIMWKHLQSLSELWLSGFPKLVALPQGLQHVTTLQDIIIYGCENLEVVLENISNLKSLKKLYIGNCPNLKSLPEGIDCLTSLRQLTISYCEKLDMSNVGSGDAIMWQHLQSLSVLWLSGLPKLIALPQGLQEVTTLRLISIYQCENLEAVLENISNLKLLRKLYIRHCPNLKSLPEGVNCLTSLQQLTISYCEELDVSNAGSDGAILWQHLESLSGLRLIGLAKLVALPQGLEQATALQYIIVSECENLEAVMENISELKSLKQLKIGKCPNLKSLPEGMDRLSSLKTLEIEGCPILLKRCREDMNDYWPKICHIEDLKMAKEEISTFSKISGLFNCAKISKH